MRIAFSTRLPGALAVARWLVLAFAIATPSMVSAQAAKPARSSDAAAKGSDDEARAADRAGIATMQQSFVKAFAARDALALAGHWTADGEYENESGVTLHGREALVKSFAEFFAKTPEVQAEFQPRSLKFVGRDAAIGSGRVTVRRGPADAATRARYESLLVREEGKWRLAKLSESPDAAPALEDLGWLVGQWRTSRGEGAEITTTYSWATNKKFLYVDFTLQEKGLAISGKQVIGIDPATGRIRSWTFEADGGVGEGDWTRDGDHWTIAAAGTLADGRDLVETNVLRRVSDDVLTWQSVERSLDGEAFPDLPPVRVTRVKSAK